MDTAIFNFFHNMMGKSSVLDAAGVFLAKYLPYIIIIAAVAYILFKEEHWKMKVFSFVFITLSSLLARGVIIRITDEFFGKARPFEALGFEPGISAGSGSSFPSGHAALLFGLAFAIFLFNRKWGGWLIGLAFVNGLARIFVGVHWPVDILGGIVVGFISFSAIYLLLKKEFNRLYKAEKVGEEAVDNPSELT